MDSPRLQDVNVRKAIALAIPYDQIIDKGMLGNAFSIAGPAPDWSTSHDDDIAPTTTDLDTAKNLMKEAGYTQSKPLKLSLIYFNGLPVEQTIATVVQGALEEIGIQLDVTGAPWATLTAQVENKDTRPDLGEVAMSQPHSRRRPAPDGHFRPTERGRLDLLGLQGPRNGRATPSGDQRHGRRGADAALPAGAARARRSVCSGLADAVSVCDGRFRIDAEYRPQPVHRAFDYWKASKK